VPLAEIPCHTQAVERTVKLVTQASSKVYGHERRDGFIRATLASRATMPTFDTKSEFAVAAKSSSGYLARPAMVGWLGRALGGTRGAATFSRWVLSRPYKDEPRAAQL